MQVCSLVKVIYSIQRTPCMTRRSVYYFFTFSENITSNSILDDIDIYPHFFSEHGTNTRKYIFITYTHINFLSHWYHTCNIIHTGQNTMLLMGWSIWCHRQWVQVMAIEYILISHVHWLSGRVCCKHGVIGCHGSCSLEAMDIFKLAWRPFHNCDTFTHILNGCINHVHISCRSLFVFPWSIDKKEWFYCHFEISSLRLNPHHVLAAAQKRLRALK